MAERDRSRIYRIARDENDMTPRQRLDSLKADAQALANRIREGELCERTDVEAAHAEMREVLRSDLLGALPLRLAGELADRKQSAPQVRAVVLRAVNAMVASWSDAGVPVPDADGADAGAADVAPRAMPEPRRARGKAKKRAKVKRATKRKGR